MQDMKVNIYDTIILTPTQLLPPNELVNSLGLRQNGRHLADNIFKCISSMETYVFR